MGKRTFWTKLNHDDARLAIDMMDDAEVGRWFRGWLAGAGGKEYPEDKVRSWPVEMRTGFTAGRESFADAERFSEKQRERVAKRYHGSTTVDHGRAVVDSGREKATGSLPSNSQQPTTNSQQPESNSDHLSPLAPQGGKRKREAFQAPTEAEWVEYCRTTWPEWHETCAAEAWAHYESAGWRMKAGPVRNWKAAAKTAHGNARNWGRLQPQAATAAAAATRYGKPAPINHRERADAEYQRINAGASERYHKRLAEEVANNPDPFEQYARAEALRRDRLSVPPPAEEGGSTLLRVPEAEGAVTTPIGI